MATGEKGVSKQALEKSIRVRRANMKLRSKLADKYDLTTGAFYPSTIEKTMKAHGIKASSIPPALLKNVKLDDGINEVKKVQKKVAEIMKSNGEDPEAFEKGGMSLPLDLFPDRPAKKQYKPKKVETKGIDPVFTDREADLIAALIVMVVKRFVAK